MTLSKDSRQSRECESDGIWSTNLVDKVNYLGGDAVGESTEVQRHCQAVRPRTQVSQSVTNKKHLPTSLSAMASKIQPDSSTGELAGAVHNVVGLSKAVPWSDCKEECLACETK